MQDDAVVLGGPSEASVGQAMEQMRALGVDRLRVTVSWRSLAPARDASRPPPGLDLGDPAAYDGGAAAVDRAVRLASARGLRVLLDLAFGAPLWATASRTGATEVDSVTQPDPARFARFAQAMARRYSGSYVPPGAAGPLPRADAFERNDAINRLRQRQRLTVESPTELSERSERATPAAGPDDIDWIGDAKLLALVERLPLSQRQVIVLRYMMEFNTVEIGELVGRSPEAVRQLHHRAMRFLRQRVSREEEETGGFRHSQRKAVTRMPRYSPVLTARRVAIG